jgi:membrane protease subunit HflK
MSSKNPWDDSHEDDPWKKKNGHGDFSFDFDKIRDRIRHFLGFDINNGGSNSGKPSSWPFLIIVAALCAIYFVTGFYQVQHDESGVVLRFGKWVRTVGPGLHYILPYPFERVILQKITAVNQIDVGFFPKNQQEENLMLTGDSNLANISFSVLWKIKQDGVEEYLFHAKSPEITVRAVAESVMREIVGQTPFTYVQTEGRSDIQKRARESLQSLMDEYKIGIEIVRIELLRVEPPASVIDSFRDVERAQAEQQSEKNRAEAYDRDKRARTRGSVAEKINTGEAKKQKIIETARGVSARFLASLHQYKLAPGIVAKRMYIDAMRDIYRGVNKIIVDDSVKPVSYLPLTELNRHGREGHYGNKSGNINRSNNDANKSSVVDQSTDGIEPLQAVMNTQ